MRLASQRYGQIQLIKELWLKILLYIGGGESKNIYGFKGEFAVEEVRLHYCLYQGERNGQLTTSMRMKKIGRLLDRLVNASPRMQNIFERFLCGYLGGFEEVYFKLRVVK